MGYLDRLSGIRKQRGLTQADLAERIDVAQPTIQRWENGKREPSLKQLHELASVLEVPVSALIESDQIVPLGPPLYLKGEVAAGMWVDAVEWDREYWQSFTGRINCDIDPRFRFGLRVVGDSMDVLYPEGTILECASVMGGAEPIPGKRVIVMRENDRHEFEATVKELVESDGHLWLVPRSHNPEHQPFRLDKMADGIVEQRITAVVVSSVRPE